eukprot:351111-Chlamydomonas_euryale.AAC.3
MGIWLADRLKCAQSPGSQGCLDLRVSRPVRRRACSIEIGAAQRYGSPAVHAVHNPAVRRQRRDCLHERGVPAIERRLQRHLCMFKVEPAGRRDAEPSARGEGYFRGRARRGPQPWSRQRSAATPMHVGGRACGMPGRSAVGVGRGVLVKTGCPPLPHKPAPARLAGGPSHVCLTF